MQSQQRDESGKNIASLAVALGFMNQAAVESVMMQQQRVLDRRREAREASRVQREAESRAEAHLPPAAPDPAGRPGVMGSGVPRRREPTPTSRWVHDEQPPVNRLRGDAALSPSEFLAPGSGSDDGRPAARPVVRGELIRPDSVSLREAYEAARASRSDSVSLRDDPRLSARPGARPDSVSLRDDPRLSARPGARPDSVSLRDDARLSARPGARGGEIVRPDSVSLRENYDARASGQTRQDSVSLHDARPGMRTEPGRQDSVSLREAYEARASAFDRQDSAPLRDYEARSTGQPGMRTEPGSPDSGSPHGRGVGVRTAPGVTSIPPGAIPSTMPPRGLQPSAAARDANAGAETVDVPDRSAADATRGGNADPRLMTISQPQLRAGPGRAPASPGAMGVRSPPFMAAASSTPLSTVPSTPAVTSATGTLLEGGARAQARKQAQLEAAAVRERAVSRPVPSGRDWRNPSRPPPPDTGLDLELHYTPPAGHPQVSAASLQLDTPRYIDRALELCHQLGASDLLLHAGALPFARIDGRLHELPGAPPLTPTAAERIFAEILDEEALLQLSVDGELRCSYQPQGGPLPRARVHAFASEQGLHMVLHMLASEAPSADRLGLGATLQALREEPYGLCVCSGPAGSGKTTTLWSLAEGLASERALYLVSLESPIEIPFQSSLGLCEQREVGRHVTSYADGIDWAVAQGAEIVVVADLLAPGALSASLRASRARCLVLAAVRCHGSHAALAALAEAREPDAAFVRSELASALRFVLHQRLVPQDQHSGRVAAIERLVNTEAVAELIRGDRLSALPALMAASKEAGMVSMDDALEELVRRASITRVAAHSAAPSSERFQSA
jgi:twitching motility protein PilT